MRKVKRLLAFCLILTLFTFNIQVRQAPANPLFVPFVIGGVTITWQVVLYVASVLAVAGITFDDTTDVVDAIKYMALSNPDGLKNMIAPLAENVGDFVDVSVATVKSFFDSAINSYKNMFKADVSGYSGSISPLNNQYLNISGQYNILKTFTYNGNIYPVLVNPLSVNVIRAYNLSDQNQLSAYYGEISRYQTIFGVANLSDTFTFGDYTYYQQKFTRSNLTEFVELYSLNNITGERKYITYNDMDKNSKNNELFPVGFFFVYGSVNNVYELAFGSYYTGDYSTNLLYTTICGLYQSIYKLSDVNNIGSINDVTFKGNVDTSNVFQDVEAYTSTVGAIENVVGIPLNDTDTISIKIPAIPTDLTREGVISLPVTVPVDPDIPIDPDIPVNPDIPINPDIPVNASLDFSRLKQNSSMLATVFPFCIPFDFVNAISSLSVPSKTPYFNIDFSDTIFDGFVWELDMRKFESIAVIVRWSIWVSFFFFLLINTRRFIRW